MGKLIAVVLVVGALIGGYVVFISETPESFNLTPSFMLTAEEKQVRDLENRLQSVKRRYAQANRSAAIGGIDTTSDIEAARKHVAVIEKELKVLELPEGRAKAKATELMSAIQQFSGQLS